MKNICQNWVIFPLYGTAGGVCTCGNSHCKSAGKHPLIKGWLNKALPRDEALKKWPKHKGNWGVIPHSSGFIAIDIDVKNGKKGLESIDKLQSTYGKLPLTMVIQTPSLGFHILFKKPELFNIHSSNGSIADGIDIRGNNGYIVAVGSSISNNKYKLFNEYPMATLPTKWVELLSQSPKSPIGNYWLPNKHSYASQSEADFALASSMQSAGCSFEQFCTDIKPFRGHDKKSKNNKYLERTWLNVLPINRNHQTAGNIDIVGFYNVPSGSYEWLCTAWLQISPFGKPSIRFDGIIVNGEYANIKLPLFIAAPRVATAASKLAQTWRTVGDGSAQFKADYLIDKTYFVKVDAVASGAYAKVSHIIAQVSDT